ncbi:SspB family protein [Hyphomicrobium sp.]|uniref:SspB family protein n=1 Tax=Hyphomicrobium sp. TaxID=82 RepID=UPI002D7A255C|nr:ClpXP protease specificity-enhancing factor SspB [Hyphomicrobium sp.]HET6389541.1 ClpXP protease specificity-enhancing factor SspB [Hyphomicrobium sp.]
MASGPSIDYAKLQQEAMRGVVRAVLQQVVKTGLPDEHHFYISFHTRAQGVILSKRLKEKYPSEMTIVLQHRFWDLIVSEDRFEVKLTFDGIPERLVVPFAAIKVFIDPSVRYGLQFDDEASDRDEASAPRALTADAAYDGGDVTDIPRSQTKKPRTPRKPRDKDGLTGAPPLAAVKNDDALPPNPEPATRAGEDAPKDGDDAGDSDEQSPPEGGAKILSLDQFRKK